MGFAELDCSALRRCADRSRACYPSSSPTGEPMLPTSAHAKRPRGRQDHFDVVRPNVLKVLEAGPEELSPTSIMHGGEQPQADSLAVCASQSRSFPRQGEAWPRSQVRELRKMQR